MPNVDGKKFPYTAKGKMDAKKEMKKKMMKKAAIMNKAEKKAKVAKVMREFKGGSLHSGKKGPVVKNKKQAVAIALSEAKMAKKKMGKKK
jgi:hypothetical protein